MVVEVDHPTCGPVQLVNTPLKYSDSDLSIRLPPPTLGQHTNEILKDILGMAEDEVRVLREKGVIL